MGGGDENTTINHGCGGSNCGGSGNSDSKKNGEGSGDSGVDYGGSRESDGGIWQGR